MALLNSLHVDEPVAKDTSLSLPKIGEVCGPLRNTWQTFLSQQNYSFVSTLGGRSVTKSVWTRQIVDILLQKPVVRSKCNMLVEECGCQIIKERSTIFLDQILWLFIKIWSFSYAKDIVQKYKIQSKGNQKERLEEGNQKGHGSKCAGLMFYRRFFHHQCIFEGLM